MVTTNMSEEEIFIEVLRANEITRKMDIVAFETFLCMIAEEYCRANDIDVKELIDEVESSIYAINDEFGKY